ncbi:unnamed protein product [Merluccius merluccius]
MALVSVEYAYEYITRDGCQVSIKPQQSYILVRKTTDHWWCVRKDPHSKPIYIPAQYVKECALLSDGPESTGLLAGSEPWDETSAMEPNPGHEGEARVSPQDLPSHPSGLRGELVEEFTTDKHPGTNTGGGEGGGGGTSNGCTERNPTIIMGGNSFTESQTLDSEHPGSDSLLGVRSTPVPESGGGGRSTPHTRNAHNERPLAKSLENTAGEDALTPSVSNSSDLYEMFPEMTSDLPGDEIQTPVAPPMATSMSRRSLDKEDINNTDINPNSSVDHESHGSSVYVNLAQLRRSTSESPPLSLSPAARSSLLLDPEGWEVHTDQDSGQDYYYHPASGHSTWDNPLLSVPMDPEPLLPPPQPYSLELPSSPPSPALSNFTASASPTSPVWTSDWEKLVDKTSGRPYFYNTMSKETSWDEPLSPYPYPMEPPIGHRALGDKPPPLPEEDYPPDDYAEDQLPDILEGPEEPFTEAPHSFPKEYTLSRVTQSSIPRAALDRSAPAGWILNMDPDGTWVFTSEHSHEQWIKSLDDRGQTYYYLRGGSKSQWNLPEASVSVGKVGNGVEEDSVFKNWRHNMSPTQLGFPQEEESFPGHRRNMSDYGSDSSSIGHSPETQHYVQNLEKAGILNKTKVSEHGKKVRKNWCQSWTVLHGGVLTFHKDPKSTTSGASSKTNQIVPDSAVDLRGAVIGWASREKSSKKNVLELKGKNGVEFLIQYDNEGIINDWHKVLGDTIRQLEYQDHHSEEEEGDMCEKASIADIPREDRGGTMEKNRRSTRPSSSSTVPEEMDQKKVRNKLIKFLMKRPTLQSVKEKGYIRDNVFGCHLATLCAQERTTVPSFVEKCVNAVERRGLDIDGIYRVSGNLAVIQKLRYKADHEELDLEDGQWEDVHVITGALKLFFRELPEPLFPYSHFNSFIAAIRSSDYMAKVNYMRDLVKSLPRPNHDTMKLLFGHLHRVIKYGNDNRMTVQNVAIVFGPTLLRPETESANIAMHMVYQNQIVELVLNEQEHIFS